MLPERIQSKRFAIVVGIFPETGGRSDEVQGQLPNQQNDFYDSKKLIYSNGDHSLSIEWGETDWKD